MNSHAERAAIANDRAAFLRPLRVVSRTSSLLARLPALVAVACASASASLRPQATEPATVEPTFLFRPADTTTYTLDVTHHVKSVNLKVHTEVTTEVQQEVVLDLSDYKDDGHAIFNVRFGRAKGSVKWPGVDTIRFDTDKAAAQDPMLDVVAILDTTATEFLLRAGKSVRVEVDDRGNVLDVQGFIGLYRGSAVQRFLESIGEYMDERHYVNETQRLFPVCPDVPLTNRSQWTGSVMTTTHGTRKIEFMPDCKVTKLTPDVVTWTQSTAPFGRAVSRGVTVRIEDESDGTKSIDGLTARYWKSEGLFVVAAALDAELTVSLADGLYRRHEVELESEVGLNFGDKGKSTLTQRLAYKLTRK